jgi:hypothetical protein
MTIPPDRLRSMTRDILLQDECATSHFGYADNFGELEQLLRTIEELIVREESSEIDALADHVEFLPESMRGDFWAENHPYWWEHIIAPQFRSAFFIALMSAVELHLGRLANDAALIVNAPITYDELKGGFYQRVRRFLAAFVELQSPGEADWKRLVDYYSVRNSLVHAGGFVRETDMKNLTALESRLGIKIVVNRHLELPRAFCETALRDCKDFVHAVWTELAALCRRVRALEKGDSDPAA